MKASLAHLMNSLGRPTAWSMVKVNSWSTESKAFSKSRKANDTAELVRSLSSISD